MTKPKTVHVLFAGSSPRYFPHLDRIVEPGDDLEVPEADAASTLYRRKKTTAAKAGKE